MAYSPEIAALHAWVASIREDDGRTLLGTPGRDGWLARGLPFSFRYSGRNSDELVAQWSRRATVEPRNDGTVVHTVVLSDPDSGLDVTWEATTHPDLPVAEWIVTFANRGSIDTPLLEDVQALNLVAATDYHELVVYHGVGGIAAPDAFSPRESVVERSGIPRFAQPGGPDSVRLGSVGGRSSNGDLPYFNVEANWETHRGIAVAIGWSGQWQARISRFGHAPAHAVEPDMRVPNPQLSRLRNATRLRIQAGMEDTCLVLRPGERIRTPRIVIVPWEDDHLRGQNLLRQFIHQKVAPTDQGVPPLPPMAANVGIVDPGSALLGIGERHLDVVSRFASLGVEYFIVDAGWYEIPPPREPGEIPGWSRGVGNYRVRQDVFPRGLRPLAGDVRKHGMKFGLWFEPERVCEGTEVFDEHRDWLLSTPAARGHILNFGNPDARKWITDRISQLIEDIGIGWYRHDANANYLPAWRGADAPDRRGITEIRYIEGLYQFWQDLLDRHPGLYIEGCSSGGRRMDIEALRYHHSYFYTDWMVGDPAAMQSHVYGANLWLPGIYCNNVMAPPSAPIEDTTENLYSYFSALGGGILCGWRWLNDKRPIDWELGRRWYDQFRALRHLAVGDFYPLLPHTVSEGKWLASQYHREDLDEGMVLAFRRRHSPTATVVLRPRAVDPNAVYWVKSLVTGERTEQNGRGLLAGVEIHLNEAPACEVLHYQRV